MDIESSSEMPSSGPRMHKSAQNRATQPTSQAPARAAAAAQVSSAAAAAQGTAAAARSTPAKGWTDLRDLQMVKKAESVNLRGWLRSAPRDISQGRKNVAKISLCTSKEASMHDCQAIILLTDPARTRWVVCLIAPRLFVYSAAARCQ